MRAFLSARTAAALVLSSLLGPAAIAGPNDMGTRITQPGDSDYSRQVTLGINKSMIVELDNPAADVVITNPDIADAVVQTSKRIIFRGVNYGQTNAFIFDKDGNLYVQDWNVSGRLMKLVRIPSTGSATGD